MHNSSKLEIVLNTIINGRLLLLTSTSPEPRARSRYFRNNNCINFMCWHYKINQTSEAEPSWKLSVSQKYLLHWCIRLILPQVSSCTTSPTWQDMLNCVIFPHLETISLYKCHYHGWCSRSCQRSWGRASLYGCFQFFSMWASMNSKP